MLMRLPAKYTASATPAVITPANPKNSSQAVSGQAAHRARSRYAPTTHSAHRSPVYRRAQPLLLLLRFPPAAGPTSAAEAPPEHAARGAHSTNTARARG
jgi:hypothetical protein